ncbi:MAG TPA: FAD-dependent thymidylate synthase [Thermoanaerobaculia bacterium]
MNDKNSTDVRLVRPTSPALDEVLGQRFPVLDDGFVRVVDYLGNDAAIVQAARVSYGDGTKAVSEDRALVRYLMRHRHTTPFEMCEIKLHVRVPMDTWRQWIRHRTANVNEYSTRYSIAIDRAQQTPPTEWRAQAGTNRQGSDGLIETNTGHELSERELELQKLARDVYEERLSKGVAREQARKDLPLSTYTEAYWKIDLHNLFHFLALRMDSHAQHEIREYATVIGHEVVARWAPVAWQAFRDYLLETVALSSIDVKLIRTMNSGGREALHALLNELRWLELDQTGRLKQNRERSEFARKFEALFGHAPDWLAALNEAR